MYKKISIFLLRISSGMLFFHAGITKVLDPNWSAAPYLASANNFKALFAWLSSPEIIDATNFANAWGLTLLGLSLVLGLFVSYSAPLGAVLMFLYYLVLPFPMPNAHAYIVDEHIIYIFALLSLAAFSAGNVWGLDAKQSKDA